MQPLPVMYVSLPLFQTVIGLGGLAIAFDRQIFPRSCCTALPRGILGMPPSWSSSLERAGSQDYNVCCQAEIDTSDDIDFVQHFTYPLSERAIRCGMFDRGAARSCPKCIAVQTVRKMKVEVLRHIIISPLKERIDILSERRNYSTISYGHLGEYNNGRFIKHLFMEARIRFR
jgi:hypothetical protein